MEPDKRDKEGKENVLFKGKDLRVSSTKAGMNEKTVRRYRDIGKLPWR